MATSHAILAFLVVAGAHASSPAADRPGRIEGVVRFTGEVPPDRKIFTGDGGSIEHNDLKVDAKTKGLRFVGAVIEDPPPSPDAKEADEPEVMDQKDMVFLPRVIAVREGRPVRFDNSDICNHSVQIFAAKEKNELNTFVTAAQPVTRKFLAEKHPLRVGCSLHGWMTAWIFVVPHPWFAVTDEKGAFTIKDVPPGKYTLWFRHPDTGLSERKMVEVKAGETARVEVEWKDVKKR